MVSALPVSFCFLPRSPHLGCPRNNHIFFSVRTETNRNSNYFGCFSVCFAKPKNNFFGLFRCFGPVSKQLKQTEFSQNKPKQTKKISKKRSLSYRGSSKPFFFFSVWTETNRNSICFGCFSVCFLAKPNQKFFFRFVLVCFVVSDRYWNNKNEQNLWYGELKGWYFNKFAAVSVGLLFVSVVTKHRNSLFWY